jgi:hypothetical protein
MHTTVPAAGGAAIPSRERADANPQSASTNAMQTMEHFSHSATLIWAHSIETPQHTITPMLIAMAPTHRTPGFQASVSGGAYNAARNVAPKKRASPAPVHQAHQQVAATANANAIKAVRDMARDRSIMINQLTGNYLDSGRGVVRS